MSESDWDYYANLVSYAPLALPSDREGDMDKLEALSEQHLDSEDQTYDGPA